MRPTLSFVMILNPNGTVQNLSISFKLTYMEIHGFVFGKIKGFKV